MTPFETLSVEAEAVPVGATVKLLCPKCFGGDSGEVSLSLTRHEAGGFAWICFRASCGYRGNPRGVTGGSSGKAKKQPREFALPFFALTNADGTLTANGDFLNKKFGFVPANAAWCPSLARYVLKVHDPEGDQRGVQAYSFERAAQLKCITYQEDVNCNFIHWTRKPDPAAPVVIVEDWFSAEKVATCGGQAVALLGTHLNADRVAEITVIALDRPVFLALDKDAFAKSIKYAADYGSLFARPLKVWKLARDLKYETADRIRDALFNGKTDFAEVKP